MKKAMFETVYSKFREELTYAPAHLLVNWDEGDASGLIEVLEMGLNFAGLPNIMVDSMLDMVSHIPIGKDRCRFCGGFNCPDSWCPNFDDPMGAYYGINM